METSGGHIVEEPGSASGKALHTDNTEGEEQCVENDRSLVPTPLRFLTRPAQNKGKPVLVAKTQAILSVSVVVLQTEERSIMGGCWFHLKVLEELAPGRALWV